MEEAENQRKEARGPERTKGNSLLQKTEEENAKELECPLSCTLPDFLRSEKS